MPLYFCASKCSVLLHTSYSVVIRVIIYMLHVRKNPPLVFILWKSLVNFLRRNQEDGEMGV